MDSLDPDATNASEERLSVSGGRLWSTTGGPIIPVTTDQSYWLAPASHCLHEWNDYWLEFPGADHLRIGDATLPAIAGGLFRIRFENRLGLVSIRPIANDAPVGPPIHLEILSPKFPIPAAHVSFSRALLDDLFARAARLPFALPAADPATVRGVVPAPQPPSPLFTLHFLLQHWPGLAAALTVIEAAPHRRLHDRDETVPLAQASTVDADLLLSILHAPELWVPSPVRGLPLVDRLRGHAPTHVRQRLPEETFDNPENRFVLAALTNLRRAAETLSGQPWWRNVPPDHQAIIREATARLRRTIELPLFAAVGPMQRFPTSSRVFLRREGYRDLLALWLLFQQVRRPLFASLQHAIDLRDSATLYEFWVFFALIEELAVALDETPVIHPRGTDATGLDWEADARFGNHGRLIYNRAARAYSTLNLRPDFTWLTANGPDIAFDAKFRLTRRDLEPGSEVLGQATAMNDDLVKMHAYRDALGIRAAVAIYPGDVSMFYSCSGTRLQTSLAELFSSPLTGVGAISWTPGSSAAKG